MTVDFKVIEYIEDLANTVKKKQEIKQLLEDGYEVKGFTVAGVKYYYLLVKYS